MATNTTNEKSKVDESSLMDIPVDENLITVDIIKTIITHIDGRFFTGVLPDSIIRSIWTKVFRRKHKEIETYNFKATNKGLKINFELKHQIRISTLAPTPDFNFTYKTVGATHLMWGKILDYNAKVENAKIGDEVIVSVSRTASEVRASIITEWMKLFGDPKGEHYFDKDSEGLSTGSYHIKLTIRHQIHEFLPIGGAKARIYYPGMPKQCTNCYRVGHLQKACQGKKIDWLDFIERLLNTELYPARIFGSWIEVLEDREYKLRKRQKIDRKRSPSPAEAKGKRKYIPPRNRWGQGEKKQDVRGHARGEKRDRSPYNDGGRDKKRDRSPYYRNRDQKRDRSPYHDSAQDQKRDRSPYYKKQHQKRDRSPYQGREDQRDRSPYYKDHHQNQRKRQDRRDRSPDRHYRQHDRRDRSPSYERGGYKNRRNNTPRLPSYLNRSNDSGGRTPEFKTPNHSSTQRTVILTTDTRISAKSRLGNRSNTIQDETNTNRKRSRSPMESLGNGRGAKQQCTKGRGY